jgi:hypothetical protein
VPLTLDIVTSAHDAAAHLERDVDVVGSFGAERHDAPGSRDSTLTRLRCPRLFEIAARVGLAQLDLAVVREQPGANGSGHRGTLHFSLHQRPVDGEGRSAGLEDYARRPRTSAQHVDIPSLNLDELAGRIPRLVDLPG